LARSLNLSDTETLIAQPLCHNTLAITGADRERTTILSQIDQGARALPEFQRGYVWNRVQVRSLMDSLYKQHPVGSLLLWATRTEEAAYRGDNAPTFGTVKLILDGQLLAAAANEFMGRLYAGTADQEPLTLLCMTRIQCH
jgi:hypothetical protein